MDELASTLRSLYDEALAAAAQSYSPYSRFRVGAALALSNGEIVTGTNVENVSYGLTICAERSAMVQAISRFGPDVRVTAAAIANLNAAPSPPCGACRQFLAEFIEPDAPVIFTAEEGCVVLPFRELLPHTFKWKP
ncbi:MAG TPA: cytidine deaminase [Terracidiphilus sp.]